MISALAEVVEGWTGALPFTLNADGVPVDLTSMTVSIILKDGRGLTVKDSTVGVSVTSSTGGVVQYAPSSSDFVAARTPYKVRFQVTDSTGRKVFFPNEDEDLIKVNVR